MIEISIEVEPQQETPLQIVNKLNEFLKSLVEQKKIEEYSIGLSTTETDTIIMLHADSTTEAETPKA